MKLQLRMSYGIIKFCMIMYILMSPLFTNVTSLSLHQLCRVFGNYANNVSDNFKMHDKSPPTADSVCRTPACIHSASRVLKYMDKKVKPCDNFYRFACGSFLKNTPIPADQDSVDSFSLIRDKIQEQLRNSIEEPSSPMEPKLFKLAKNLYKLCMNKTAIEAQGHDPLLKIVKKLGGWPVLEGNLWNDTNFDLIQSAYQFSDVMIYSSYLLDFGVIADAKNNTKHVLHVNQKDLDIDIDIEYLSNGLDDKIVKAYYSYMVDIAVILGAEREIAKKQLLDVLKFEITLAEISVSDEGARDSTLRYNPMTIGQLSETYPNIPWRRTFNQLLPPSIQVDDSEVVIVDDPSFMTRFEKLMEKTSKRVQANYVMWRLTRDSISDLTEQLKTRRLQYLSVLNRLPDRRPRWKKCLAAISYRLPISVSALYVRKYFHQKTKKSVIEMTVGIREQFNKILQKADWMDDETRKRALEKAASMAISIAYPDELLDDKKLGEVDQNLELSDGNYYQSGMNLALFGAEYQFSKLRKPVDRSNWMSYLNSAAVNALHTYDTNSVVIPAGILRGVYFDNDRPKYMNYGAIGYVIGHEIAHGFDNRGSQFDKDGNLVDWWAPSTKKKFLAKVQCLIDQYRHYTVEEVGLNLRATNTQREDIADNGGLKAAYLAYNHWSASNGQEQMLPGLPYTPRQMFWISAANAYCSVSRLESLKYQITTDVHNADEFRVLEPMSNMPEFAEDFKCPVGSNMNPKKKCAVL